MNAYELADALLKNLTMEYDCDKYMEEAANMLRQQADRIAELEKSNKVYEWDYVCTTDGEGIAHISMPFDKWIELRDRTDTTPQIKKLSDEEIEEFAYAFELWQLHNPDKALEGIMDFARAILKKASEK